MTPRRAIPAVQSDRRVAASTLQWRLPNTASHCPLNGPEFELTAPGRFIGQVKG